jgi:hypothetical protein
VRVALLCKSPLLSCPLNFFLFLFAKGETLDCKSQSANPSFQGLQISLPPAAYTTALFLSAAQSGVNYERKVSHSNSKNVK